MNCPTCGQHVKTFDGLKVDLMTCRFAYNGSDVKLTPQQAVILSMLRDAGPSGLSYDKLLNGLNGVWGDQRTGNDTLRVQKSLMAKKLAGTGVEVVPTYGRGYRLVLG